MKSLKGYAVTTLVLLMTALTVVACSKKASTGGQSCPPGYVTQYGTCTYNPGNGGYGTGGWGTPTPGMGLMYGKNGHIVNMSKFKDFNLRVDSYANQSAYWCFGGRYIYGVYIDCDDAYVALIKSGTNYYVQVASSSLTLDSVALPATKFGGSTATHSVFEVYYTNPYSYKIAELSITGDMTTGTSVNYTLSYFTNSAGYQIVTGTMYKNYDY
jgi:hypothetical protein